MYFCAHKYNNVNKNGKITYAQQGYAKAEQIRFCEG